MDLRQFHFEKIINDNSENLSVAILAKHNHEDKQAIIIFAKKQFTTEQTTQIVNDDLTKILRTTQANDKFSQYDAIVDPLKNDLMISMIFPATEREIAKYSSQKHYLIRESPEDWKKVTEPYIQSIPHEHKQWLLNIVEHKSETERILFEDLTNRDTGFILVPDFKWDQARTEFLYTLVIALRDDIRCVRDLTGSHIEMLENMKQKTLTAINKRWNIPSHFIRLFVHYLPSYYHFHIHACHVNCPTYGNGLVVGKAIMLDDIIDNLKMNPNYYQQTNLSFTVKELDPLFKLYVESGKIQLDS